MITVKLTVNSIVDISRLCICIWHLAPLPPNLFPIPNIIEHSGDKWGKFFLPSNGNIWIKASNISWFLGFLFSALPCFLSHLVFKFCIIAHGSNQEEKNSRSLRSLKYWRLWLFSIEFQRKKECKLGKRLEL